MHERLQAVIKSLRDDLNWRSPVSGKPQNIITMRRVDALVLLEFFERLERMC
jgi:hypothetical protein